MHEKRVIINNGRNSYTEMMWTDKYRPHRFEDLIGNDEARLNILKWLKTWVNGKKPLFIVGPPGVGKTSFVHILSKEYDFDLVEMNASDSRNRDMLESRVIPVLNNTSLSGKRMLLFLDEVDGIYRRQDTGGLEFLSRILKEPTIPIILASNSRDQRIKELIKVCRVIEFSLIPLKLSRTLLDQISFKEGLSFSESEKDSILNSSQGDIRSLLNTAQSAHAQYMTGKEPLSKIEIGVAIDRFFAETSVEKAKEVISKSDSHYADPRYGLSPEDRRRDIIYAFFTSIVSSRKLDIKTKADLLAILSTIDMSVGRIFQKRNWKGLRYLNEMLVYGMYNISRNKGVNYSQYAFFWPTIGQLVSKGQALRSLLSFLASETHSGYSVCGSLILPYFLYILSFQTNLEYALRLLDLDQKQVSTIAKEIEGTQRHLAQNKPSFT
jgi:replication factor C large subunit